MEEPFIVTAQLSQQRAPNQIEMRMRSDGSYEPLPSFPIKQYEIRTGNGKIAAGAFGTVCETDYGSDPETGLTNVLLAARK